MVNGIQKKLGLKKEPLILLHHRRTKGGAAASSFASNTLNRWQESNSIYTTPTGSNDDWYVPQKLAFWRPVSHPMSFHPLTLLVETCEDSCGCTGSYIGFSY